MNNIIQQPKIMNNIDDAAFMSSLLGDLESKVMKNEPKSTVKLEEPENIEVKIIIIYFIIYIYMFYQFIY